VAAYVDEWVVGLEDITDRVVGWRAELRNGGVPALPRERAYELPGEVAARIGAG
jgi:hypothetical protein